MPQHNHSGTAASGTISRHYHGVSTMVNNNGYFYAVNSGESFDSKITGRRNWNGSGGGGVFESTAVGSTHVITSLEKSGAGTTGGHSHTITISNQGSNTPHNNMQPYINVYMWKRIA